MGGAVRTMLKGIVHTELQCVVAELNADTASIGEVVKHLCLHFSLCADSREAHISSRLYVSRMGHNLYIQQRTHIPVALKRDVLGEGDSDGE